MVKTVRASITTAAICLVAMAGITWIIANTMGNSLLIRHLNKLKERGEPIELANFVSTSVKEDHEGLQLLTQSFRLARENDRSTELHDAAWQSFRRAREKGWDPEIYRDHLPMFEQIVLENHAALGFAEDALSRAPFVFPVDYSHPWTELEELIARNHGVRLLSGLFGLRALVRANKGDGNGALADCERILTLARILEHEPLLTSQLVRLVVIRLAIHVTEGVLRVAVPNVERLNSIGVQFETDASTIDLRKYLQIVRVQRIQEHFALASDRMWRGTNSLLQEANFWLQRPKNTWKLVDYLDEMERMVQLAALPYGEKHNEISSAVSTLHSDELRSAGVLFERCANDKALLQVASIACFVAAGNSRCVPPQDTFAELGKPLNSDPNSFGELRIAIDPHFATVCSVVERVSRRDNSAEQGVTATTSDCHNPRTSEEIAFSIPVGLCNK